jgi:hypothetical protein
MPPDFSYPGRSEFWLAHTPRASTGATYFIDFIGRLRPSATVAQAGGR